jgi:nucleotide sugar dehydrogenase
MLVVLESTTYPGTTDELVLPLLEQSGLKGGKDFFLAFSPERIDPGNPRFHTRNVPKVIGGLTPVCTELARALYAKAVDTTVPVSSPRVAEMVKLLENTFRAVNIGLVNELAIMCDRRGGHQAVRLHALLSRTGPRRPLSPCGPVLSLVEGPSIRVRGAFHRVGRRSQRGDAALHHFARR